MSSQKPCYLVSFYTTQGSPGNDFWRDRGLDPTIKARIVSFREIPRPEVFLRFADVKRYQRAKLLVSLCGSALLLVYAALWAAWGGAELAALTENRWVGLLVFAGCFGLVFELLTLPLTYYADFIIEHRYELSNQTFVRWLGQLVKGWLVGGLIGGLALAGLYGLLWYGGQLWWLWVWVGWIALTVVLARLFPVLLLPVFYKSQILEDERITHSLIKMANDARLRIDGIFKLELSTDTKAANAMLTGLGSTRRVYLSDTLLDSFSPEEIDVIFAHELGHHTRKHIWKMLCLSAVLSTLPIAAVCYFLHPAHGAQAEHWPEAIALLPLIVLCVSLLGMILNPIAHAVSRRFERQCDADALRRTQNPQAYRSAFERLAEMNLADPDPHPFVEWYFHDHPAMSKRIAVADSAHPAGS